MHQFSFLDGILHCEGVSLQRIAEQYGTPTYVYSANTIRENFRRLRTALAELNPLICFAMKSNSNLAVLNLLAKEGAGFDLVSGGELFRVLKAGGDAGKCTFAGVGKTVAEIEQGLAAGIYCFNVESESELFRINEVAGRMGLRAPVAVRINPDVDPKTHKFISTGKSQNKFGIGIDRAEEVYEAASKLPHLQLRGVQTHIGSQILDPQPFSEAAAKLAPVVKRLKERFGIEFFSFGGGIGIPYRDALASGNPSWWNEVNGPACITPERYAAAVVPHLAPLGVRILLEPGRFLVGNAGALLSTVQYIKKTRAKTFCIVDAGMNDLIRPALYEGYHEIVPIIHRGAKPIVIDVVGPVCESGDFFAQDREVSELAEGDVIALLSAGAYGFVMASNYNSRTLPAEILVNGERADLVRERQTFDDLIRGECIPQ